MILVKAYDLFDRQGFHVTPMREIAKETNLSKAALYYHFENKKALMIGILEMVLDQLRTKLFSIAYDTDAGDAKARLEQFFAWQENSYNTGPRSCFIGTMTLEIAAHDQDFATILNTIFGEWEDALTHLYSHFHDAERSREIAQQTIMEFEGAVMLGLVRNNKTKAIQNAIAHALARTNN